MLNTEPAQFENSDNTIILCTGFSGVISEEEAKSIGINEFIMKQIVISEIACKVRDAANPRYSEIFSEPFSRSQHHPHP